jgi:micrococcal nuclease
MKYFFLCLLWIQGSIALALTLEGTVTEVHDGDTVKLKSTDGVVEKVRLIGIDAPEIAQAPFGKNAKDSLEKILLNKKVRMESDVAPRDHHGRLLGYIYVKSTNELVNETMIASGQAVLLTVPPNVAKVDLFIKAQNKARLAHLGVWSKESSLAEMPDDFRRAKRGKKPAHLLKSFSTYELKSFKVKDGESLTAQVSGQDLKAVELTIKMIGVDAPNGKSKKAQDAKSSLESLVKGHTSLKLETDEYTEDSKKNILGYIYAKNIFVNAAMIKSGKAKYRESKNKNRSKKQEFVQL